MAEEQQLIQTEPTEKPEPDWDRFMAGIDQLNETVGNLHESLQQPTVKPAEAKPAPALELPDNIDEMSRGDLVRWMRQNFVNGVVEKVTEIVKPALDAQQQSQMDVATERYTREIGDIMAQKDGEGRLTYPDFRDWQEEMIDIVKEMPGVTPLRAYNLARSEDPEKRAALDKKYTPKQPELKAKPFSLSPYGTGESGPNAPTKHKTSEEAFRAALAKTNAKFPGILPSLET